MRIRAPPERARRRAWMVEASVAVPEPGGGARRRGRQVRSGARARCGLAVRLQTWTTNGGRGKAVLAEAANWAEEFGAVYAGLASSPSRPLLAWELQDEENIRRVLRRKHESHGRRASRLAATPCLYRPAAASPIRLFNRGDGGRLRDVSVYLLVCLLF